MMFRPGRLHRRRRSWGERECAGVNTGVLNGCGSMYVFSNESDMHEYYDFFPDDVEVSQPKHTCILSIDDHWSKGLTEAFQVLKKERE